MRTYPSIPFVFAFALLITFAGSSETTLAIDPPITYQNLRYQDDVEAFRDAEHTEALDAIKFISLNQDESVFLSLGGQARLRWEYWDNFGFAPPNDDDFFLMRLRLHADLHIDPYLRLFVEGKSALASDRDLPGGRRALDVDSADLQNAFLDIKVPIDEGSLLTLRSGRQELQYGKQRLVSPLDWSNTRRTWDGFRLLLEHGDWQVDGFATYFVPVEKYEFNENESDSGFHGIYATHKVKDLNLLYDLYWLFRDLENVPSGETTIDDERYTVGLRLGGTCGESGVDYDLEGGFQYGDRGDLDIGAWFFASQVGYKLPACPVNSRVYLGFDYASGDDDPNDGDANTFNQLYPLGHAYLGFIDIVGRQNIIDFSQGISMWPIKKKLLTKIDNHILWRAEKEDALYNAGGGVVRAGDTGDDTEVGVELDLLMKYILDHHTNMILGYSHFFAGDFISESGPDEDIDFVYASVQYTF